ncbi:hypothetical protein BEWA_049180 [Theileria equi strain WA]|uniref:Signal peptide containing protein n=1 Tax=Theileria equi strain WA TaxID=1537102 RepID=L1LAU4_THEEQ|nr:hypothetical protein BEWA_049180 [Theileria equi strain WA]EKX72451.1 hypothetical protein BEWA_049180 [Theileria equi strain WA]|eukprot:XP_004831903.1 hypothetical protein BEWA_049180 [Theileria equi strain WA]
MGSVHSSILLFIIFPLYGAITAKGDSILVYLKVDTATGLDLKYLERVNGKWKDVTTTEFYQKVGGMRMKKEESQEKEKAKHLERAKDEFQKRENFPPVTKVEEPELPENSEDDKPEVAPSQGDEGPSLTETPKNNLKGQSSPLETTQQGGQQEDKLDVASEVKQEQKPAANLQSSSKGALNGTENKNPPEPTHPESSLTSKVDSTLFNVLCSVEDNVKVLKLTIKEGTSTNRLLYDSQTVWEDKKKSCLSAVLYMDGEKPTLAVLVTNDKKNKEGRVYKYHDGKKWKNGNESNHKKKLKELQDAAKPKESTETVGDNVEEKAKPADKPEETPAPEKSPESTESKEVSPEASQDLSTNKPDTDESPVVQQNTSTSTQSPQGGQATAKSAQPDQKTTESAKKGQGVKVKPVESPVPTPKEEVSPQDNGTSKPATDESPVPQSTRPSGPVLDLANPDESKVNMSTNTHRGLTIEDYTPKDAVLITSVVDGPTSIWTASGNEKFVSAKYAHRGGCSQGLEIKIKDGNDTKTKKFEEKADGKWAQK